MLIRIGAVRCFYLAQKASMGSIERIWSSYPCLIELFIELLMYFDYELSTSQISKDELSPFLELSSIMKLSKQLELIKVGHRFICQKVAKKVRID